MHTWQTHVHMYTKYEVSMSNPGGGVHRWLINQMSQKLKIDFHLETIWLADLGNAKKFHSVHTERLY